MAGFPAVDASRNRPRNWPPGRETLLRWRLVMAAIIDQMPLGGGTNLRDPRGTEHCAAALLC